MRDNYSFCLKLSEMLSYDINYLYIRNLNVPCFGLKVLMFLVFLLKKVCACIAENIPSSCH